MTETLVQDLSPGDVFRPHETWHHSGNDVVVVRKDHPSNRVVCTLVGDTEEFSYVYERRPVTLLTSGRPHVTEVTCSRCGRPLGDFSDGTTPREVVGPCCPDRTRRP